MKQSEAGKVANNCFEVIVPNDAKVDNKKVWGTANAKRPPSTTHSNANIGCCQRWWLRHSNTERGYLVVIFLLLSSVIILANILTFHLINFGSKVQSDGNASNINICFTHECVRAASAILDRLDERVEPCTDFYQFACGSFITSHTVPDDHYNRNLLQEMQDEVYIEMKNYLEMPINESDGKSIKNIKLLYLSCMNESSANDEKRAVYTLLKLFRQIGGQWPLLQQDESVEPDDNSSATPPPFIHLPSESSSSSSDRYQLEYRLASLFMYQVQPFFHLYVAPDDKNSSQYALHLYSGSTVLESNYFSNSSSAANAQYINAYIDLQMSVATLFAKFLRKAEKDVQQSVDISKLHDEVVAMVLLEADLANITKDSIGLFDSESDGNQTESFRRANATNFASFVGEEIINDTNTNETEGSGGQSLFLRYDFNQLEQEFPLIRWKKLFSFIFDAANISRNDILIHNNDYLVELMNLFSRHSWRTIDNYLCWTIVARFMPYLGPQFRRLYADFRRQVPDLTSESSETSGTTRIFLSRWKECVHVASEGLDIPATLLYLKHKRDYLTAVSAQISDMIESMKQVFYGIIDNQDWLRYGSVRRRCKQRTSEIGSKIGIPKFLSNETYIDMIYESLKIEADDVFIVNIIKMAKHEVLLEVKKLVQEVDQDKDWVIQPLIVNAFYETANNNIILPAGILRFPLLNMGRPKYLDYSTLGVVVGHEIAHSMDSNARKVVLNGNTTFWWPNDVVHEYEEKAKCFAKQFTDYTLAEIGENLNGNLTLEENICDFAGLQQAYVSFKKLGDELKIQLPGLTQYTSEQLFFIQYAQVWCEVANMEGIKRSLYDNHSPGRFRANGVLENTPQFSKAFSCKPNSPMHPEHKCSLWSAPEV